MKKVQMSIFRVLALALMVLSLTGADVGTYMAATTVSVTNSSYTAVTTPLDNATAVQIYIRPSSTAQSYTVKMADNSTIEVPSGNAFTAAFKAPGIKSTDTLFSVQTASSSATLQVIAWRDR